jgi:hypothetical protein
MNLTTRDRIATLLVAAALVIYGLWLTGIVGGLAAGSVAVVVLALGVLASASAVVPGFMALLRGSRAYLVIASLLGLAALVAGVLTVMNATESTLAILVIATLVLWAAATLRHAAVHDRPGAAVG